MDIKHLKHTINSGFDLWDSSSWVRCSQCRFDSDINFSSPTLQQTSVVVSLLNYSVTQVSGSDGGLSAAQMLPNDILNITGILPAAMLGLHHSINNKLQYYIVLTILSIQFRDNYRSKSKQICLLLQHHGQRCKCIIYRIQVFNGTKNTIMVSLYDKMYSFQFCNYFQ